MTRAIIAAVLCAAGTAACGRGAEDVAAPIVQTGCLTGSNGEFALTTLESGAEAQPRATTETFQLVGNEDELRQHVGKQVRIAGEAEPPSIVEARETSPPEPTATSGEGEPKPQVSTQAQTRLEVSRLRVTSVTPTGDTCEEQTTQ